MLTAGDAEDPGAGKPSSPASSRILAPAAAAPRAALLDLLPLPNDTQPVSGSDRKETSNTLHSKATLSHALAASGDHDGENGGTLQQAHQQAEVLNMGWNEGKENIAEPLIGGLSNEDLWVLVRRFNKQIVHVKAVPYPVQGNLDLHIADEEEFSPDKLRANFERLYTTALVSLLAGYKHIARLRSWREQRRTACFCAAYFIAWAFDLIMPLLTLTLIILILHEPSRGILFPPAPIALVSSSSGGVQKPIAGVLGSTDSATGAAEHHKGEAVEQEAHNFVAGIASVALSSAVGKHHHPQQDDGDSSATGDGDGNGDRDDGSAVVVGGGGGGGDAVLPDPTALAMGAADARDKAASSASTKPAGPGGADKTKVPMEAALWAKMRPVMHGIAEFTDMWERVANALSPTPPFPKETPRLRLAVLVMPVLAVFLLVSSYVMIKIGMFVVGVLFFGEPVIAKAARFLDVTRACV